MQKHTGKDQALSHSPNTVGTTKPPVIADSQPAQGTAISTSLTYYVVGSRNEAEYKRALDHPLRVLHTEHHYVPEILADTILDRSLNEEKIATERHVLSSS